MKVISFMLLVIVASAHSPVNERQWIKFIETPAPLYYINQTEEKHPEIILAEYIDIRQPLAKMSQMAKNTMTEFAHRYQECAEDVRQRLKRAMEEHHPYRFVRKPELRHQYGMLFNHHGYIVSGLKNLELFLSIELPKITDIQHTPPPFPSCDNWAVVPPSRCDRYLSILGWSTSPGLMRQRENRKRTKYLEEAVHTVVCTQYKYKYQKLLERIDAIK